jgi:two-component system, NarL family, invasion response regulator UvrY
MTRKVLIVDDHEVVRDGVKRLLDEQLGAIACGEAGTPDEALRMALGDEWDVVVLDLSFAGKSGLEVLRS